LIECFNCSPSAPPPKEKEDEEQWSDVPSDVVHLKDSTFDEFMEKNPSVLVMFYAPCMLILYFSICDISEN